MITLMQLIDLTSMSCDSLARFSYRTNPTTLKNCNLYYNQCDDVLKTNINIIYNNVGLITDNFKDIKHADFKLKKSCLKTISYKLLLRFDLKTGNYINPINKNYKDEYLANLLYIQNVLWIFLNK